MHYISTIIVVALATASSALPQPQAGIAAGLANPALTQPQGGPGPDTQEPQQQQVPQQEGGDPLTVNLCLDANLNNCNTVTAPSNSPDANVNSLLVLGGRGVGSCTFTAANGFELCLPKGQICNGECLSENGMRGDGGNSITSFVCSASGSC